MTGEIGIQPKNSEEGHLHFSLFDSIKDKETGLTRIESRNKEWLRYMRLQAFLVWKSHGKVTADDCRKYAAKYDRYPDHPNAWGAIFRGYDWHCVGHKKSEYVDNHAREIKVWVWRGGPNGPER